MVAQLVIFLFILEIFYLQLTTSPGLESRKVKPSSVIGIVPLSVQLTSVTCFFCYGTIFLPFLSIKSVLMVTLYPCKIHVKKSIV